MAEYKVKKGCVVNLKVSEKDAPYEVKSFHGDKGETVEMSPQDALSHLDVLDVTAEEIAKQVKGLSAKKKL